MRLRLLILLLPLTLAACMTIGDKFDMSKAEHLVPGISTENDAVAALGRPTGVTTNDDGTQTVEWQYVYATAWGTGGGGHASIQFGNDRKMIRLVELSRL